MRWVPVGSKMRLDRAGRECPAEFVARRAVADVRVEDLHPQPSECGRNLDEISVRGIQGGGRANVFPALRRRAAPVGREERRGAGAPGPCRRGALADEKEKAAVAQDRRTRAWQRRRRPS